MGHAGPNYFPNAMSRLRGNSGVRGLDKISEKSRKWRNRGMARPYPADSWQLTMPQASRIGEAQT